MWQQNLKTLNTELETKIFISLFSPLLRVEDALCVSSSDMNGDFTYCETMYSFSHLRAVRSRLHITSQVSINIIFGCIVIKLHLLCDWT